MRIATSTIYQTNIANIDNLNVQYQQEGTELSTGKALNVPSDDPQQIAQDLSVRNDNAVETQVGTNLTDLTNQLTAVDGAMSSLTSLLQGARSLAIQGASETVNSSQLQDMATQVDQMLSEAVGIANTQYAGKYIFAGTAYPTGHPLVLSAGSPITSVTSQSNEVQQVQQLPNGQTVPTGVTLQQAFNYNSPNGSPDVFQTLINLRDTLQNGLVVDESSQAVNLPGTSIDPAVTTLAQLEGTGANAIMSTPLTAVGGNIEINVANGQNVNGINVTIPDTDTVSAALTAINTQLAAGGVSVQASFNAQTQRISFASTSNPNATFEIQDIQGNFTSAFGLTQQATTTGYVSTQIGDIDNVLTQDLNAQAIVGAAVQTVNATNQTASSQVLNDTTVQSNIEDTDIPKVTSEFSQTQTVLQAAYATTSRLEEKTLMDYLS